ncbi:uncharacterized protein YciI [Kibdelosporangium banguiense]|uniref:Uncharacterized protein YciI n=1 Tax=Kibdelosporangium banguiense TaxID=1365924 RepID=A0ABS4TV23_9PSEU|nr:YciI family protein [Kibdelosporangium banguiense]MBP2327776.1 uncharacterized protein YciI [Kibdelosporangium banguiense]
MALFLLTYGYNDSDLRAQRRDDHVAYLNKLKDAGSLVVAGPYNDLTGGAILYQADSEQDVEALIAGDPYTQADVTKDRYLREWRITVGAITG